MLITTKEVAALLKVHPKQVYRLLKQGLPAHRVGDEWRFDPDEVRRFYRKRAHDTAPSSTPSAVSASGPPPLLAANGDVAVELLLEAAAARGAPLVGRVLADHATGLDLLQRGAVLLTGCHGSELPAIANGVDLARVHLADREVGLAFRRGLRLRRASSVVGRRFAARPATAGIRGHLDEALRREGVELDRAYDGAHMYASHRDVVIAIARGDVEVGLTSRAWAASLGLAFLRLASESYGLVMRAADLGDPHVVALCEVAQSASFRKRLGGDLGYDAERTGEIRIGREKQKAR